MAISGTTKSFISVTGIAGQFVIVLIRENFTKFKSYSLLRTPAGNGMNLTCELNVNELKETTAAAGPRTRKIFKTNGAVIRIRKPEASETVFYWEKSEFKQVTTID